MPEGLCQVQDNRRKMHTLLGEAAALGIRVISRDQRQRLFFGKGAFQPSPETTVRAGIPVSPPRLKCLEDP